MSSFNQNRSPSLHGTWASIWSQRSSLGPMTGTNKEKPNGAPETNSYTLEDLRLEPENTPLEKENHLPNHHFQVLC